MAIVQHGQAIPITTPLPQNSPQQHVKFPAKQRKFHDNTNFTILVHRDSTAYTAAFAYINTAP